MRSGDENGDDDDDMKAAELLGYACGIAVKHTINGNGNNFNFNFGNNNNNGSNKNNSNNNNNNNTKNNDGDNPNAPKPPTKHKKSRKPIITKSQKFVKIQAKLKQRGFLDGSYFFFLVFYFVDWFGNYMQNNLFLIF